MSSLAPVFDPALVRVGVAMVVSAEPKARIQRAIDALGAQRGCGRLRVVIAAPPADHRALATLRRSAAVETIELVANPTGKRSVGLNKAIGELDTDLIVRVDARAVVHDDYVARAASRLHHDPRVGMVGGVQRACSFRASPSARGAARALRNRWLLGNADYRRPGRGGVVDTVYLGVFRRAELLAIGGYDERLDANEDFELCARYRAAGRSVWLERGLIVDYEPRAGVGELFRQYQAFGASKVRFWRLTDRTKSRRQQTALALAGIAGAVTVASVRRPARVAALGAAAFGALAAVDHIADPSERELDVRLHAWASSAAILGGWLSGVASETVRERLSRGAR